VTIGDDARGAVTHGLLTAPAAARRLGRTVGALARAEDHRPVDEVAALAAEFVAGALAIDDTGPPALTEWLDEQHAAGAAVYEQVLVQARRLVRDGISPARAATEIAVMIEQSAGRGQWAQIAAHALIVNIDAEMDTDT
jgi:hypothetical protein